MSMMPVGAVLADTTQSGQRRKLRSVKNAKENNIFNTGTDPLWSFVDISVPEQALVGQEFEIDITVKNMGTGSGMFPEFRFTEESDKKTLSHFSIVGGTEDGVYDTMLTEVKGGETKTFTIKMKVNAETKELPEGSKYRINWHHRQL